MISNIGSPDAPTATAVRRYLDEFLGDPMVVDQNRLLWWVVRKLIILPLRSPRSAAAYRAVWSEEGSPLVAISKRFAEKLALELGFDFRVALGMRYGNPSLAAGAAELSGHGCERIVCLPAFPQYSRTTSGTLEKELARRFGADGIACAPAYYADSGYIGALAASIAEAMEAGGFEHVVFSFHGLPLRYVENGDPYRDHCEQTAALIAARLSLTEERWTLCYQSRFGREPWLEPATADRVLELARRHPRLLVACPGFTADCLETLEEIGIRLRKDFLARGGLELQVVPCLNDDPRWVRAAADCVRAISPCSTAPLP